jgi:hypothetical protein
MNVATKLALLTALLVAIAVEGPNFCVTHLTLRQAPSAMSDSQAIRQSIIKVHTEHGVITLPGTADSWDEVENAIFIADSIADVQIANGGIPSAVLYE